MTSEIEDSEDTESDGEDEQKELGPVFLWTRGP